MRKNWNQAAILTCIQAHLWNIFWYNVLLVDHVEIELHVRDIREMYRVY